MVNAIPGKGEVCTATSAMIALHLASQQLVSDPFGPVVACYYALAKSVTALLRKLRENRLQLQFYTSKVTDNFDVYPSLVMERSFERNTLPAGYRSTKDIRMSLNIRLENGAFGRARANRLRGHSLASQFRSPEGDTPDSAGT
ncbi:hypothetical protein Q8A73_009836 [Channa argus]|nr:hypothetical protein Q8A73_009836 [Channa argus]